MKGKLLVGLTLASLFSVNSFAMEITHGKLLSHKEWTTGRVKAASQDIKHLQIPALQLPSHKFPFPVDQGDYINEMSEISWFNPPMGTEIPVNTDQMLYGVGDVLIDNETTAPVTYTITTSLDVCMGNGGMNVCFIPYGSSVSQDVVTLDAHNWLSLRSTPVATINSGIPEGVYYSVTTSVSRQGGTTVFNSSSPTGFLSIVANSQK